MTTRSKIETNKGFRISIQTEDKAEPSMITIKLISWLMPTIKQDYTKAVLKTSKALKSLMYKTINKSMFHADRTIVTVDTADKLMNVGKTSHVSINVCLYQHKPYHQMKSDKMIYELNEVANLLMNELITRNDFLFSKTKTQ